MNAQEWAWQKALAAWKRGKRVSLYRDEHRVWHVTIR